MRNRTFVGEPGARAVRTVKNTRSADVHLFGPQRWPGAATAARLRQAGRRGGQACRRCRRPGARRPPGGRRHRREGALYVGGNGLGHGYPGDAASTSMVFVADPRADRATGSSPPGCGRWIDKSGNIAFMIRPGIWTGEQPSAIGQWRIVGRLMSLESVGTPHGGTDVRSWFGVTGVGRVAAAFSRVWGPARRRWTWWRSPRRLRQTRSPSTVSPDPCRSRSSTQLSLTARVLAAQGHRHRRGRRGRGD